MFSCYRSVHIVPVAIVTAVILSPIEPVRATMLGLRATSATVRFHSGDLDTPQGVAGLYRRIRAAAQAVCGQPDDALLFDKVLWNECVDQAIVGAVASVHSDSVSAYRGHQSSGRKRNFQGAPKSLAARATVAP